MADRGFFDHRGLNWRRRFTISLLFRMSSKMSDACTKAAGEVYSQTLLRGAFVAGGRPNRRESCCNGAPTASPVTEPPMPNGVRTEASGWPVLT